MSGVATAGIRRSRPVTEPPRTPVSGRPDSSGFSAHVLLDGRYCLDEPIGRGAAAYVWRATDLATLEKVAVKIFSAPLGHTPQGHEALREAAALAAAVHPRVVGLLSHGSISHPETGARTPYLVLELVPGPNLRQDIARHGAMQPDEAARLGRDVAAGLCAVHAGGYVHRDMKPSNILLDRGSGTAKISDLGTAVDTHRRGEEQSYGSLPYMSPEQVHGTDLTAATDIYSLGLVLLECLTGVRAFDLPRVESMVVRTVRGPEIPAALPGGWRSLLAAMTSLSVRDRPTAEECRTAFSSLLGESAALHAA